MPLTNSETRGHRRLQTRAVVPSSRQKLSRLSNKWTNPRKPTGTVATLDLPFLVESVNFFDLIDDFSAQQLAIGFANMNETRTEW